MATFTIVVSSIDITPPAMKAMAIPHSRRSSVVSTFDAATVDGDSAVMLTNPSLTTVSERTHCIRIAIGNLKASRTLFEPILPCSRSGRPLVLLPQMLTICGRDDEDTVVS